MTDFTLLVIDDQPEVIRELVDFFRQHFSESRVLQTVYPLAAIEILRQEKPDLVFTDWDMPGMNGIELLQAIKEDEELADIPVILCSGKNIDSQDLYYALSEGAVDYLRKPFDDQELIARVMTALRERQRLQFIRAQASELSEQKRLLALEKERNEELLKKTIGFQRNDIQTLSLELARNRTLTDSLISKLEGWMLERRSVGSETERALRQLKHQLLAGERLEHLRIDLEEVNTAFYHKLKEAFPSLTKVDLEVCAYSRIGLSGKEIAIIRGVSPDSVKRHRNRLRKRLNLPVAQDISQFLITLG